MKKILILGSSGGCLDLLDLILDINMASKDYEILGFLDDNLNYLDGINYKIHGKFSDWKKFDENILFATAIGSQFNFRSRGDIIKKLGIPGNRFPTLIHPTSIISHGAKLSQIGVIIHAFCKISINVNISEHVLILPSTVVNHDSTIGRYSILNTATNIAGSVNIGESCYIGAGSKILPHVKVGDEVLLGAGSLLTRDATSNTLYYGHPAKRK